MTSNSTEAQPTANEFGHPDWVRVGGPVMHTASHKIKQKPDKIKSSVVGLAVVAAYNSALADLASIYTDPTGESS